MRGEAVPLSDGEATESVLRCAGCGRLWLAGRVAVALQALDPRPCGWCGGAFAPCPEGEAARALGGDQAVLALAGSAPPTRRG